MKLFFVSLATSVLLAACAGTVEGPTLEETSAADYGAAPDAAKIDDIVKAAIGEDLVDPYSAMYTFKAPVKSWWVMGGQHVFGFAICGTVNAKNRMGGYVGAAPYVVFYKNGSTVGYTGSITTMGGEAIANKCSAPMAGPFVPLRAF